MSKQTYRICCCFRRRFKLGEAGPTADIKELFGRYSDNGIMTAEHLQRFMAEVQGEENVTKEEAEAAVDATIKELKHLPIFHRRVLNLEAFFGFLFSNLNPPLPPPNKNYGVIESWTRESWVKMVIQDSEFRLSTECLLYFTNGG